MKKYTKEIVLVLITVIVVSVVSVSAAVHFNSANITFIPDNSSWNVSNTNDALNDLYDTSNTKITNFKTTIAQAITDMGVTTADDADIETMANNIRKLSSFSSNIEANIYAANNEIITNNFTILESPIITNGEMQATSTEGLSGSIGNSSIKSITIKMTDTIHSVGNCGMIISFGGSNSNGGVISYGTANTIGTMSYYAYGTKWSFNSDLFKPGTYNRKYVISPSKIDVYTDDTLLYSGKIDYYNFAHIFTSILTGNFAIGYNQSLHTEYAKDATFNNVEIIFNK